MKKTIYVSAAVVAAILIFLSGWFAAFYTYFGEASFGTAMNDVSALGYIEKGDQKNAAKMLQMSIEENILRADKFGTPFLDHYDKTSRPRWVQQYAKMRAKRGAIEYPDGGDLNKKIDEVIAKSTVGGS